MTDLVQRLRAAAAQEVDIDGIHWSIELEAADRIEALEAALRKIAAIDAETDKENRWDFPSLLGRAQDIAKRILGIETLAETISRGALGLGKSDHGT